MVEQPKLTILTLLAAVFMFTGCSSGRFLHKWSRRDKALLASTAVLLTVDALQTKEIIKNDDFYEKNPVLRTGNSKIIFPYFALCLLGIYLAADNMEPEDRTLFLGSTTFLELFTVIHNNNIGVGFPF